MLITSALKREAASSNEVRVGVLGSKKKLTSVLPRSAGTFLISRVPTCLKASAVSRMKLISSAESSRSPSKSLRFQFISFFKQPDRVWFLVDVLETDLNLFARRRRQIFADVIGANRQLAMAAVDQCSELNSGRSSKRADRVHRGARGATREKNIVDNDDR